MLGIKGHFLHSEQQCNHVSVLIRVCEVQYKYALTLTLGPERVLSRLKRRANIHILTITLSHTQTHCLGRVSLSAWQWPSGSWFDLCPSTALGSRMPVNTSQSFLFSHPPFFLLFSSLSLTCSCPSCPAEAAAQLTGNRLFSFSPFPSLLCSFSFFFRLFSA